MKKILMSLFLVLFLISSAFSISQYKQEEYNRVINNLKLSDVILLLSIDIINNESEVIKFTIDSNVGPFDLQFISTQYAFDHGITACDLGLNCTSTLFGQYSPTDNTISILPENINTFINTTDTNIVLAKVVNTYTHELFHMYQHKTDDFFDEFITILNMNVSNCNEGNDCYLHNYDDFFNLDLTDIPDVVNNSVNFPNALSSYGSRSYAEEIQVRIGAVCYTERDEYDKYWKMIELRNISLCNSYNLPSSIVGQMQRDTREFFEAYLEQVLEIVVDDSIVENTEQLPTVGKHIGDFLSNFGKPVAVFLLILGIIFGIIGIFRTFPNLINSFVKKK